MLLGHVAGMQPAVDDRLRCRVGAFVIALEHDIALDQHFAVIGDLDLDPRQGVADTPLGRAAMLLGAGGAGAFGHAEAFDKRHADAAEKGQRLG